MNTLLANQSGPAGAVLCVKAEVQLCGSLGGSVIVCDCWAEWKGDKNMGYES
jgi:hypothetical protein